ncbi:hypothetical protein WJX72_010961 [[Myrmecia] bisecta]|uniref:FAD-dependent oxidoreductase domain-containing protein 1 n=1 Tax=[Myrmecia] bisecta TaxID=41462 RepID=A0AAW1RA49_9CHLO
MVKAQQQDLQVDVAVVGAGVIGLCVARALVKHRLSVALVERQQLCAGATGAGQGYIWLAHRSPRSAAWPLAVWSKGLWEDYLSQTADLRDRIAPEALEWQACGSVLVACNATEALELQARRELLDAAGVHASLLDRKQLQKLEPALHVPHRGAGLLVAADAQLNGRMAAQTLMKRCNELGKGRFHALLDEAADSLLLDADQQHVQGVQTGDRRVQARLGVVVAAGAWTSKFLCASLPGIAGGWATQFQPRRGHLLEFEAPEGMPPVRHGLMEMGYTKHYAKGDQPASQGHAHTPTGIEAADITFTATTSTSGSLLVGSSREFTGWSTNAEPAVIQAILSKAQQFLPALASVQPNSVSCRVGLRPYAVGSLPQIGPFPGVQGLFVAAGHEGSGLTLGPATGEILRQYITGGSCDADLAAPFKPANVNVSSTQ